MLRDRIVKLKDQYMDDDAMAEKEMKAAFKPKRRPRQKEGIFG
jgi:hypothetical protein